MIDKLTDSLGLANPPNMVAIRGELVKFSHLAETLEGGQSAIEADREIEALEAKVHDLEATLNLAETEIKRFQEEEKERTANYDLAPLEREIMRFLGGEDFPVVSAAIADNLRQPRTLVQHHLDVLWDGKFVSCNMNPMLGRTNSLPTFQLEKLGRAYVAKHRLFSTESRGVETKDKKEKQHSDLPTIEEQILVILKEWEPDPQGILSGETTSVIGARLRQAGFAMTDGKTRVVLRSLVGRGFVGENDVTYGNGSEWFLLENGEAYLAERDKL